MTQKTLGEAAGLSHKQIHMYELGKDRVAAGTLKQLGEVLGMHPREFFGETAALQGGTADLREAMSMAAAVQKITSPPVRKRFIALIEELAGQNMDEPGVAA